MQKTHLQTQVTWFKGLTLFNGIPGILKLDGDEISFTSSDGDKLISMNVSEVKEFNVIGNTSSNFTRFSIQGMLFGVKRAQWFIIPRQKIDNQLSFIRSVNSSGDSSYKDWQRTLKQMGVTTYSDTKDSFLIITLCFISAIVLMILWAIVNTNN